MKLDLSSLEKAITSLDESILVVSDVKWFSSQLQPVQHTLIAGVIQNFEFVYELCVKMVRRRIQIDAATPTETDFIDFRDLLRTAAEKGLIANVEAWFSYRMMRNLTSHTYDDAKAQQVYQGTLKFISDAKALLDALSARNA